MNILILGGGGREHALAWAFAQNPKCDRLWCAPGQRRHRRGGDLRRARHPRRREGPGLLPRERHRLRDGRPGGAAGRGRRRRAARRRRRDLRRRAARRRGSRPPRPSPRRSAPPAAPRPPRARPSPTREAARAYVAARGRADRGQGRRARRRQGRDRGRRRSPRPRRRSTRSSREGPGARVVIEEFMAGEEASLFVLADGEDFLLARHRPGPQARLRRRPGPEHRRHGRLFAGAGDDAPRSPRRRSRASSARRSPRWPGAAPRSRACSTPG